MHLGRFRSGHILQAALPGKGTSMLRVQALATGIPAALAILLAGVAPTAAAPPCPPADKECTFKALKASPLLASSHWAAALRKPVHERIGIATPEVVEYLQLDVALND